jgi:hypothetical protein
VKKISEGLDGFITTSKTFNGGGFVKKKSGYIHWVPLK